MVTERHGLDRLDEAAVRQLHVLADELHACQLERDAALSILAEVVRAFDGRVPHDPDKILARAHELVVVPIERAGADGLARAIDERARKHAAECERLGAELRRQAVSNGWSQ